MFSPEVFSQSLREVELRLREEGIPLEELNRRRSTLLGPGVTLGGFIETLRMFDRVEISNDMIKYRGESS